MGLGRFNGPALSRRAFLGLCGAGIACASGVDALAEPFRVGLTRAEVRAPGLPPAWDGLRIGLASDLHVCRNAPDTPLAQGAQLLAGEDLDLLALLGDYTYNDPKALPHALSLFKDVPSRLGTVAVLGNHDYGLPLDWTARQFLDAGMRLLCDMSLCLKRDGEPLWLVGLHSGLYGRQKLDRALSGLPPGAPALALVHEPDTAELYAQHRAPFPLQLSGHTHGGQMNLPLLGRPMLPPEGRLYPEGLLPVRGDASRQVFVTRGVGTLYHLRLNCPPEVAVLTLRTT